MKPLPPPGLEAKYDFDCGICHQPGYKGERIVHAGGRYVHADCHQREHE